MADRSSKLKRPVRGYGEVDPLFLAGPFVAFLNATKMTTGTIPTVTVTQLREQFTAMSRRMAVQAMTARETSAKDAATAEQRAKEEVRVALQGTSRTMWKMIEEGLDHRDPDDWVAFWETHCWDFADLTTSLQNLNRRLGKSAVTAKSGEDLGRTSLIQAICAHFPEAEDEVVFINSVVNSATKQTWSFQPIDDVELDKLDEEFFDRCSFYSAFFGICLLSLGALAFSNSAKTDDELVQAIFSVARHAAFEFSRSVMEAAELREQLHPRTRTAEIDPDQPHMSELEDDLAFTEQLIQEQERVGGGGGERQKG